MLGLTQIDRQVHIHASPEAVWEVLADSSLVPRWVPMVSDVDSCSVDGEAVGSTRRCRVAMGGRDGHMVERVLAMEPGRSITYVVDEESFGMTKMHDGYGFTVSLEAAPGGTSVTIETFYTPRNVLIAAANVVFMRRSFRGMVDQILAGLKRYTEQRAASTAS